jgi:hypothetical protein
MKTFVEHIDLLSAADRERLGSNVPDAIWTDVEEAGNFAWLPIEHNLVITRALAEALGPRRTHDFFVELMLSTYRTPLLKSLVDAVLRLRGNDLGVMLQWVSKGFDLMFKNVGTWRVIEREPTSACLEVSGLPAVVVNDRVWLDTVCSSMSSLFSLARVTGLAAIRDVDPSRGKAVIRLRWEEGLNTGA